MAMLQIAEIVVVLVPVAAMTQIRLVVVAVEAVARGRNGIAIAKLVGDALALGRRLTARAVLVAAAATAATSATTPWTTLFAFGR